MHPWSRLPLESKSSYYNKEWELKRIQDKMPNYQKNKKQQQTKKEKNPNKTTTPKNKIKSLQGCNLLIPNNYTVFWRVDFGKKYLRCH